MKTAKLSTILSVVPLLLVCISFGWYLFRITAVKSNANDNAFLDGLSDILTHKYQNALVDFTSAANAGNPDAAFDLGQMYLYGEGVKTSSIVGLHWMLRAAQEGNSRAAFNLSFLYENGGGVPFDDAASDYWRQRVSADTFTDHFSMNEMFDDGDDGPDQLNSAIAWTLTAADADDPISEYVLGLNYDASGSFREDDSQALFWYQKAAQHGLDAAEYNLGSEYYNGHGTTVNLVLAYKWYKLAELAGDETAAESCTEIEKELTASQASEAALLVRNFRSD